MTYIITEGGCIFAIFWQARYSDLRVFSIRKNVSALKALEFFGCRDFFKKNSIHVNNRSTMEKIEEKLSHRTNL